MKSYADVRTGAIAGMIARSKMHRDNLAEVIALDEYADACEGKTSNLRKLRSVANVDPQRRMHLVACGRDKVLRASRALEIAERLSRRRVIFVTIDGGPR